MIFKPSIGARLTVLAFVFLANVLLGVGVIAAKPATDTIQARPLFHTKRHAATASVGLDPTTIKAVYNLANSGAGRGTIAIIDAYDTPTIQNDLATFSTQFGLPQCTSANACFEKHTMAPKLRVDSGWSLEASLDVQWAHAIAPGAKILLVEAKSANGSDLLNAVNYARSRPDVVAISMSWGGSEFSAEASYDSVFTSSYGASFFAASGDKGAGISWPAVSPNVIGVGGTSLALSANKVLLGETAWSGSGGGVSTYEPMPGFQTVYGVTGTNGKRAVPDVSYNADPNSGVAVYDSMGYQGQIGWFEVGGTSAGAPQWAAIKALGSNVYNTHLYQDAQLSTSATYFRDILTGANGICGVLCNAGPKYDMITGLGSPLTATY